MTDHEAIRAARLAPAAPEVDPAEVRAARLAPAASIKTPEQMRAERLGLPVPPTPKPETVAE